MSTRALEIEADLTLTPTARMLVAIVEHIRVCLVESGAPFSAEQEAIMADFERQLRGMPA